MSSPKRVDSLVVMRVVGISLVVANHAQLSPDGLRSGGLNLLLLVSGASIARFAFSGTTRQTIRLFRAVAVAVAVPSVILALLTMIAYWSFDPLELILVSNWFSETSISLFPMWYSQVFVQMLLGLGIVFFLFDLTPTMARRPILASSLFLFVSLLLATTASPRLPHLHLWNFVLGWFLWSMVDRGSASPRMRWAACGVALAAGYFVFFRIEEANALSRLLWLAVATLIVVWVPAVNLPPVGRHVVLLVNYATLQIFLLHQYVFVITRNINDRLRPERGLGLAMIDFALGIVVPVLLWTAGSATLRAWRRRKSGSSLTTVPASL